MKFYLMFPVFQVKADMISLTGDHMKWDVTVNKIIPVSLNREN